MSTVLLNFPVILKYYVSGHYELVLLNVECSMNILGFKTHSAEWKTVLMI
jgi:hypothetical protein